MPANKRKDSAYGPVSQDIKAFASFYCRKCMRNRAAAKFMKATDLLLDTNGYMSVCVDCINAIYDSFYAVEPSMDKTILKMCRLLNVRYDSRAVDAAEKHINSSTFSGRALVTGVFGIYKSKLDKVLRDQVAVSQSIDFTFVEPFFLTANEGSGEEKQVTADIDYLAKVWGPGLSNENYKYLEEEFAKWAGPLGNVTHSEEVLIRELCHKQNQIREARIRADLKNIDPLVESFQKLLKSSGLEPAMQKAASSGKNQDCWGNWLKDIETKRPADLIEERLKYRDAENLDQYYEKHVRRACQNFITGSREFVFEDVVGSADIQEEDSSE